MTNSLIPRELSSFTGRARLVLDELYVPEGREPERVEKTIVLDARDRDAAREPVTWRVTLGRRGHYHGQYQLLRGGKVLRSTWFYMLYGAETDRAEGKPADFDAFWARAMAELATMPPTFTRLATTPRAEHGSEIRRPVAGADVAGASANRFSVN